MADITLDSIGEMKEEEDVPEPAGTNASEEEEPKT